MTRTTKVAMPTNPSTSNIVKESGTCQKIAVNTFNT
jgi:hypothetical protein